MGQFHSSGAFKESSLTASKNTLSLQLDAESCASEAEAGGCPFICGKIWKMITFYTEAMESQSVTLLERIRSVPFAFEFHMQLHQCGKNRF